jgi:hypothetical protein
MAKHTHTHRGDKWRLRFAIHLLSGSISLIVVIIFAIVKFTAGAWVVVVVAPFMVIGLIRLNKRYRAEEKVLDISPQGGKSANITRHDVAVLIDNVDLATIGAIRYARSLKPRKLSAVHFVIDDRKADEIREAWDKYGAFDGITLELIDCPDRRLTNAAIEYSLRETESPDVELTLLLPRRSYSRFLGRLLHDQTAESIASAIAQLERVVATIVPFDVEKILDGKVKLIPTAESVTVSPTLITPVKPEFESPVYEPVGHYAKSATKIGDIQWRKRAEVVGRVTGIRVAPKKLSPQVEIEIWDETGGVRLQFIGRREIAGLEVGTTLRAEGMVGEEDGKLTILNPSYEIII